MKQRKGCSSCTPKFQQKTMQKEEQGQRKNENENEEAEVTTHSNTETCNTADVSVTQIEGGNSQKETGKPLSLPSPVSSYGEGKANYFSSKTKTTHQKP